VTIIETEVLLVGAGPIGIELAVALKARGIAYVQLDANQVGSTIAWYAPQTHFFSSPERIAIAGVPLQTLDQTKATREEYLTYLRAVVQQFDLQIETFERVVSLRRRAEGGFEVTSVRASGERHWRARYVVLAIGDMHRPRLIGVPGEDLPHVSHYFGDPHQYFRRRVLIVGGQNSAVEAAIRCYRVGARVTLSYRGRELDGKRIKFWLLPEIRSLIRDGRLVWLPSTTVREIRGDRVLLDPEREIVADAVLLLTGYEQDSDLFEQAGVTLDGEGRRPRFDEQTMETNVPGLFVAGTGTAGTQIGGVKEFIETSHVHVARIVAALTRTAAPAEAPAYELPEA
jgi:thioredoxin reductase (NADPH)